MNEIEKNIVEIGIDDLRHACQLHYMDGELAILDIRQTVSQDSMARLNMDMLIGCYKGSCSITVNARRYELRRGDLLWCKHKDVLGNAELSPDCEGSVFCMASTLLVRNVQLNGDMLRKLFRFLEHPLLHISEEEMELLHLYGNVLEMRIRMTDRPCAKEVVTALTRLVLLELHASLLNVHEVESEEPIRQRDYLFQRFIQLLGGQEVKPRVVDWYGDQLCVTAKYLSTICKEVSGRTAFEWINEYVMADIRYQLKYTQRSIKEIADYLEFPNSSFFGKYVRQHVGCSPKEYRHQLQQGLGSRK